MIANQTKMPILLVDDDATLLASLRRALSREFAVSTACGGQDALALLREQPFAVVVSDLRMPHMDGITFLSEVQRQNPDVTRILLTGNADLQSAMDAVNKSHIFRLLTKPVDRPVLQSVLQAGIEQYELIQTKRRLEALQSRFNLDSTLKLRAFAVRAQLTLSALEPWIEEAGQPYINQLKNEHLDLVQFSNNFLSIAYLDIPHHQRSKRAVDINQMVNATLEKDAAIHSQLESRLETRLMPDLPHVLGQVDQIALAFSILVTRAAGASARGRVSIKTSLRSRPNSGSSRPGQNGHASSRASSYNGTTLPPSPAADENVRGVCLEVASVKSIGGLFVRGSHRNLQQVQSLTAETDLGIVEQIAQNHGGILEAFADSNHPCGHRLWFPVG